MISGGKPLRGIPPEMLRVFERNTGHSLMSICSQPILIPKEKRMAKYKISSADQYSNIKQAVDFLSLCLSTTDLVDMFLEEMSARQDFKLKDFAAACNAFGYDLEIKKEA